VPRVLRLSDQPTRDTKLDSLEAAAQRLLHDYRLKCDVQCRYGLVGERGALALLRRLLTSFVPEESKKTALQAWTRRADERRVEAAFPTSPKDASELSHPLTVGAQALTWHIELGTLSVSAALRLFGQLASWLENLARWDMTHVILQRVRLQLQLLTDWSMVREHMVAHVFHTRKAAASGSLVVELLPAWARADLAQHYLDAREHSYTKAQFARAETHDVAWNAIQRQLQTHGHVPQLLLAYWLRGYLLWWKLDSRAPSSAGTSPQVLEHNVTQLAQGPIAAALEQLKACSVVGSSAHLAQTVADALCIMHTSWARVCYSLVAAPGSSFHRMVLGRVRPITAAELFKPFTDDAITRFFQDSSAATTTSTTSSSYSSNST